MRKNKKDTLPEHFKSVGDAAEFWDSHDVGDYLQDTKEVHLKFNLKRRHYYISVTSELFNKIQKLSKKQHLPMQALTGAWLKEKLKETSQKKAHAVKEGTAKYTVRKGNKG